MTAFSTLITFQNPSRHEAAVLRAADNAPRPAPIPQEPLLTQTRTDVKVVMTADVTEMQRAARQHVGPSPGPGWARFTIVDVFSRPLLGGPEVRRLREKPGGQADAGCAPRAPRPVARNIKQPPPPPPFLQIWEDVTPTSHTSRRHPAPRTAQGKAEAHLKSVEAAVRLQSEVLGVLQGVNVAVLDDEVAQVLGLWGGAGETRKLRAGAKGSSSPPRPHTAPQTPGRAAPSYQHFTKKWEQGFLPFAVDKYQLGRRFQRVPQPGRPNDSSGHLVGSQ